MMKRPKYHPDLVTANINTRIEHYTGSGQWELGKGLISLAAAIVVPVVAVFVSYWFLLLCAAVLIIL